VIRVLKWLQPKQIFNVFELKRRFEVFAIAKDLNLFFGNLVKVAILEIALAAIAPEQVIHFHGEKSSE
jgi:hypothetical protein